MTVQQHTVSQEQDFLYDFSGPLWERYFKSTRKQVRFPRNYKEVTIYSSPADLEL
jgi:hypothetical protein